MKKQLLLKILFLFHSFLYAQTWDYFKDISKYAKFTEKKYTVIKDTNLYSNEQQVIRKIRCKQSFSSSQFSYVFYSGVIHYEIDDFFISYENGWITVDDIALNNSDIFPESLISNKNTSNTWIPTWYNSIINDHKTLEDYSDYYTRYKGTPEYFLTRIHNIKFRNTLIEIYNDGSVCFAINGLKRINNIFNIFCEIEKNSQSYFNEIFEKESLNNLPDLTENRNCTFIIEQNGNRLRLYNGENYKLIIELMQTDNNWNNSMLKYIEADYKNKPSNLTPIEEKLDHPWSDPKTGLYEGTFDAKSLVAVQSTNVTPNKTMTVSENLKLHSVEATSTQVLAVMQAGTKVKILELGKAENIDGINSNWVKVEVQSGAKDRDGRTIRAGTVGWCYGGYLE